MPEIDPVPDPTPEEPMEPKFLRLAKEYAFDEARERDGHGSSLPALSDLHRWHRDQVERAVRGAWQECIAFVESLKGADAAHEAALRQVAHRLRGELDYRERGPDV